MISLVLISTSLFNIHAQTHAQSRYTGLAFHYLSIKSLVSPYSSVPITFNRKYMYELGGGGSEIRYVHIRVPVVSFYMWKLTKFLARLNTAWENDSIIRDRDCCEVSSVVGTMLWRGGGEGGSPGRQSPRGGKINILNGKIWFTAL
jgi:hypothetical protein